MTFEEKCIDLLGEKPQGHNWFLYEVGSYHELEFIIKHLTVNQESLEVTLNFSGYENSILYEGGMRFINIYPESGSYVISTTSICCSHDKELNKKEFYGIINPNGLFFNKIIPKLEL